MEIHRDLIIVGPALPPLAPIPISLPKTGSRASSKLIAWVTILTIIVVLMGVVGGYVAYTWMSGSTVTFISTQFNAANTLSVSGAANAAAQVEVMIVSLQIHRT